MQDLASREIYQAKIFHVHGKYAPRAFCHGNLFLLSEEAIMCGLDLIFRNSAYIIMNTNYIVRNFGFGSVLFLNIPAL